MRSSNRFIATLIVVIVWGAAGYAVASGPSAYREITPATPGVVTFCLTLLGN